MLVILGQRVWLEHGLPPAPPPPREIKPMWVGGVIFVCEGWGMDPFSLLSRTTALFWKPGSFVFLVGYSRKPSDRPARCGCQAVSSGDALKSLLDFDSRGCVCCFVCWHCIKWAIYLCLQISVWIIVHYDERMSSIWKIPRRHKA